MTSLVYEVIALTTTPLGHLSDLLHQLLAEDVMVLLNTGLLKSGAVFNKVPFTLGDF